MDKNTIKGLIVMAAIIMVFMMLNKPQQQPNQAANSAQEQVDDKPQTVIDSIKAADVAYLADYIRQAGTATDDNTYTYVDGNVVLELAADNSVSGSIQVDKLSLTYDNVVNADFPEEMTLDQKKAAVDNLRSAIANAQKYGVFSAHRYTADPNEQNQVLENNVIRLEFSNKGGYIAQATLKKYFTYFHNPSDPDKVDTANVVMFSQKAQNYFNFTLRTVDQTFNTSEFRFTPNKIDDNTLEMNLDLGGGAQWGIRYTIAPDSYLIKMDIVQKNMGGIIPPSANTMAFNWDMTMPRQELSHTFEERNSGVYYKYVADSPDNLSGMKSTSEKLDQPVKWIAFKNQFFSNVIIPTTQFESADIAQTALSYKDSNDYVKRLSTQATFGYDVNADVAASFDLFIGPNLYPLLSDIDDTVAPDDNLKLTRLVPLGWSWLRWINTLIVIPVFNFLGEYISSYGIIILLLTIFIKLLLSPFTYKSYKSQAKMRVLAPEIKEINEKYPGKENAMVRNQKTMALYSRAGASPFSGCLPMLLQMPILIAMFSFFPSCIELRGQSFLWADNLAAPDVVLNLPFTIPFYGSHVSLFCLLMTAVNIIYTRINMQNQPSTSSTPGMKWMMYLMPVMFLFFFNDYAAALSYYYFLSLLITIIQTYLIRRFTDEKKLRKQMMENAAKPKKKSGFMARLEEAQRRQQAMMKEQQKNRRR